MTLTEADKPDPILEEAVDWLLRLQNEPASPATTRQFEAWLRCSDAHAKAWETARKTWHLMGEEAPALRHLWHRKEAALSPAPQRRRKARISAPASARPRRRTWAMAMVAAAIAGIFLVAAMPTIMLRLEADYITATAESRNIRLRDGTLVMLGADSAISVNIGDSGPRKIRLLSGEAYFDVAHDASHPFVVDAGGVDVTVLGTAFDVRLSTMATTVQLARGSVDVSYKHPGVPGEARLMPGEMAVVDRATGQITRGTVAQKDIASWREGQLFVNDETIGSVVEQLQRYHSAWIKLPDGNLAARRVTGLYDLRDPDRALRALVQPYGGKVRELSPYVRVLSHY